MCPSKRDSLCEMLLGEMPIAHADCGMESSGCKPWGGCRGMNDGGVSSWRRAWRMAGLPGEVAEQLIWAKMPWNYWGLRSFLTEKGRERKMERSMVTSELTMDYICFSYHPETFRVLQHQQFSPLPIITSSWLQLCFPLTPSPLSETPCAPWVRFTVPSFLQASPMPGIQGVV